MQDNRRYYSLDALRGSMMMLGIILHGSQWYLSSSPGGVPIPTDPSTSGLFDAIMHFIHSFRMPLFFLLAGFFTSLLVDKRGIRDTYVNRAKRILGPLAVACVTILPLTGLFLVGFIFSARFGTHQLMPTPEQARILEAEFKAANFPIDQPSLGHLWFLYYLLYFYLLIPVCHLLVRSIRGVQGVLNKIIASPVFFLALVMMTIASLWSFRAGLLFEGFLFIKPHLPSLIYYGTFFVVGYVIHDHRLILETFSKYIPHSLILSIVLFPLSLWASNVELSAATVSIEVHAIAVMVNAMLTWSLIYLFMGLFLKYLDYKSPWILYISNSSYWVYLFHMPVITFAAWVILPIDLHAFVKFPLIVVFTTVICFLSYHYWVQNTWVSSLLNGIRFDHPWPWQIRTAHDGDTSVT